MTPFYFTFLHDLSTSDLASLFPNETVGLVRARNAGCCAGGVRSFASYNNLTTPPTLRQLAALAQRSHYGQDRSFYVRRCIVYVVALRLGRHKFVKRQFRAWAKDEQNSDTLEENLRHYVLTLLAARKAGRQGI